MRRFVQLIFLCLLLSLLAQAKNPNLRVIVVGDTKDDNIGASVAADMASYNKLAGTLRNALAPEGVQTTMDVLSGNNCSYGKLNSYLNNLQCEDDIVLFVYNGHGGRSHQDNSKFPRMCLGSNYVNEWMKVSDLNNKLRAKHPRLMVVVTDCCNSYYDRKTETYGKGFGIGNVASNGEGFRQLFLNNKGEVCITGASPGEYGWGMQDGGMLSVCLLELMYEYDRKGSDADWNSLMQDISDRTFGLSEKFYRAGRISKTQRPVFDVKVSKSGRDSSDNGHSDISDSISIIDDPGADDSVSWIADTTYIDNGDDDGYIGNEEDDDESGMGFAGSLWNSVLIALAGLVLIYLPKVLNLTGSMGSVCRIFGYIILIWAFIAFFVNL